MLNSDARQIEDFYSDIIMDCRELQHYFQEISGIPTMNQVRPGQVRILIVSAPGHDWSGFVQLGRTHLNHWIPGCRTGLNVPFTSRSILGYNCPLTFF